MPSDTDESWKRELEKTLARTFTASERRILEALSELLQDLGWRDSLYPRDLEPFDPEFKTRVSDPTRPISEGIWKQTPQSEQELLQYLAFILQKHQAPVPEFLNSVIDTSEIARHLLQQEREKETRLWKNRLSNLSQQRPPIQNQGLDVRLRLVGRSLRWEAKGPNDEEYQVVSAKEFGQWLARDYGFLERFNPSSIPLCALFQEYFKFTQRARIDLEKEEDCSFFNKLLLHPAAQSHIVNKDEQPLSYSDIPLRWSGVLDGIFDDGSYRLHLELATGDPAPFPLTYLPGETPLYLHADQLFLGPPLLKATANPNQSFEIPAEALEAPEGLLFLRNHSLPLPASVSDNVVYVPLQLRLYCDIRKEQNEWSQKTFCDCRLIAVSTDLRYWFILGEDGWEATQNRDTEEDSPEAPEGTLFELPPNDYVQKVLQAFSLSEDEDVGIWSREIDAAFPSDFVQWIQDLPPEIQLVPDEELDTLLDGRPAGRYALSIDNEDDSDWFNLKLETRFADTGLTEEEKNLLLKARGEFAYLPGKGWKRFEAEVTEEDSQLLDSLGIHFDHNHSGQHALHTLQLSDAKLEETAFASLQNQIRKRAKELSAKTPAQLPKGIRAELRPYQIEGFKFLSFLSHNRFGGILADDMGLGKTLQTLTWLTWLKLNRPAAETFRCLVVCPKSVMHVWQKEVETHASHLNTLLFEPDRFSPQAFFATDIDILVVNYSQLRIHRAALTQSSWTVTILDEAQYIKNPNSQTTRAARELKAQHRIALTGTPVENRAMDLWSIFSYAMPGLLGSRNAFAKQYRENDPQTPKRLFSRVRHFMIRRSKSQVATDLPDRIEESLLCQMEGDQRNLYQAELKLIQQKVKGLQTGTAFDKERFNILASLLRLRQICCHPALLDPAYRETKSAKLEALLDLVSELREEGHKVLIFSQFVEMLKIISESLAAHDCPHLMLTGQTKNRQELVEQFQNDPSQTAFLLSLKAAGSGLNLTAASYVVLYDPWWNPAVEAQAIDRTHRIGQKNTVNAYRLIAKDSVEQKIQSLQLKKENLANEIVREESLSQILDLENLKYVLGE